MAGNAKKLDFVILGILLRIKKPYLDCSSLKVNSQIQLKSSKRCYSALATF
ncbi:hypothetical protein LguiB_013023 [Lonicera macranthoides]